jgi:hypothetical protein
MKVTPLLDGNPIRGRMFRYRAQPARLPSAHGRSTGASRARGEVPASAAQPTILRMRQEPDAPSCDQTNPSERAARPVAPGPKRTRATRQTDPRSLEPNEPDRNRGTRRWGPGTRRTGATQAVRPVGPEADRTRPKRGDPTVGSCNQTNRSDTGSPPPGSWSRPNPTDPSQTRASCRQTNPTIGRARALAIAAWR